jgi:outer membrane protein assembly factor BamB
VAGISESGKLLWYAPNDKLNIYCIALTPIVKDDKVYMSAGEGAGCNLYKITKAAGKFQAKDGFERTSRKVMQNGHGGVVLVGDRLFGFSNKGWMCQDWATGKEVWFERNKMDCNSGALTCADGHLYLLGDDGEVVLLEASANPWVEKGRITIPALSKSRQTRPANQAAGVWTHPVVANGRFYVRDQELLYCYAVK